MTFTSRLMAGIALAAGVTAATAFGVAAQDWRHGRFEEFKGPHSHGSRCLHRVAAHGIGHSNFFGGPSGERKAIVRAERHWEQQVASRFGGRYASWRRAAGKDIRCERHGPEFHCVAIAHPCS